MRFDSLPAPKFKYSPAVRMGPFVKTAGMVGLDPKTGSLVDGGAAEEFRQILTNLDALRSDNGLNRSDLVSATLFVTAFHRFQELNEVWDSYFADEKCLPTRTSIGATQLPIGAQIEAEFLFFVQSRAAQESV